MRRLTLNLSALAVIAMGGMYLAAPSVASAATAAATAECKIGDVVVSGDICTSDGKTCKCA